jgi:hypothetical protein
MMMHRKGSGYVGPNLAAIPTFAWGDWEISRKTSVRMGGVPAGIRNETASLQCLRQPVWYALLHIQSIKTFVITMVVTIFVVMIVIVIMIPVIYFHYLSACKECIACNRRALYIFTKRHRIRLTCYQQRIEVDNVGFTIKIIVDNKRAELTADAMFLFSGFSQTSCGKGVVIRLFQINCQVPPL